MNQELWTEVDDYITDTLALSDPALEGALTRTTAAGLPAINVAPNQGKLLQLLAQIQGATRILEVGTLGGYSTIWLARALPEGGSLVSLELDPRHAEVARESIAEAGLADKVEVRLGAALDTLAELEGPFDFTFIDADKEHNADYFQAALRLSKPGSVIVVDNVIRRGTVLDADASDLAVQGTRRLNVAMAAEPRVSVTEVQTVGSKGHDGFALALVLS